MQRYKDQLEDFENWILQRPDQTDAFEVVFDLVKEYREHIKKCLKGNWES